MRRNHQECSIKSKDGKDEDIKEHSLPKAPEGNQLGKGVFQ